MIIVITAIRIITWADSSKNDNDNNSNYNDKIMMIIMITKMKKLIIV